MANGKPRHSWIENRRPPVYGDGLEAGCLIMREFEILLQIKSDTLSGIVKDVNSKDPVPHATINIENREASVLPMLTDSAGRFNFGAANSIKLLSITALGYREIRVRPRWQR